MTTTSLTPTQDLILGVLSARRRLGEAVWTFSSTLRRPVEELAQRGLVNWKHGVIERTILVWFTDTGLKENLSATYVPPVTATIVAPVLHAAAHLRELDEAVHPDKRSATQFLRHLADRPSVVVRAIEATQGDIPVSNEPTAAQVTSLAEALRGELELGSDGSTFEATIRLWLSGDYDGPTTVGLGL